MRSFEEISNDCITLINKKQSKYVRGENPHQAFQEAALAGGISEVNLILARISDKSQRIRNMYAEGHLGTAFDGASILEEAEDMINYGLFLVQILELESSK